MALRWLTDDSRPIRKHTGSRRELEAARNRQWKRRVREVGFGAI